MADEFGLNKNFKSLQSDIKADRKTFEASPFSKLMSYGEYLATISPITKKKAGGKVRGMGAAIKGGNFTRNG